MKTNILNKFALGAIALTLGVLPMSAQRTLPADKAATILLSKQAQNVSGNDTTFTIAVAANTDYSISTTDSCLTASEPSKSGNVRITVKRNFDLARSGSVMFTDAKGTVTRALTINQEKENTADYVTGDTKVKISGGVASSFQPGANIDKSFDGDYTTTYHSNWTNTAANYFPITLDYNFSNIDVIDYMVYHPRGEGSNGNFKEIEVWYRLSGEGDYTKYGHYDFGGKGTASMIIFEDGLVKPVSVRIIVKSGSGDGQGFATCAEMEFFQNKEMSGDYAIFADNLMTTLRPEVTQDVIDTLSNPFCQLLAQKIIDGTYTTEYRVNEYECLLSVEKLSDMWSTPGKYYDQLQGVTGINVTKGKHVVIVEGIPDGVAVGMRVVAWYNGDGQGPAISNYFLKNGINTFEYNNSYDGIA